MGFNLFDAVSTVTAPLVGITAPMLKEVGLDFLTQGAWGNAQAQRDINSQVLSFQERVSNTAYQRATADMRAAGLNPALGYTQGGASTPTPNLVAPRMGDVGAGLASNAKEAIKMVSDLKEQKSRTSLNDQQVATSGSQAGLNESLKSQADSQAGLNQRLDEQSAAQRDLLEKQTENAQAQNVVIGHNAREAAAKADIASRANKLQSARQNWDLNLQKFDAGSERAQKVLNFFNPFSWFGGSARSTVKGLGE